MTQHLLKSRRTQEKNYPMDKCKWIAELGLGEIQKRPNIQRPRKEIKFEEA